MTNLEIIEAALNRLDPEREFREALMHKLAADLACEVTPYKHPETDFVCEGVRKYGKVIDTPFPELPEVYSTQPSSFFIDHSCPWCGTDKCLKPTKNRVADCIYGNEDCPHCPTKTT